MLSLKRNALFRPVRFVRFFQWRESHSRRMITVAVVINLHDHSEATPPAAEGATTG